MGLYLKRHKEFVSLGIWEIEEPVETLFRQAVLSGHEKAYYDSLRTPLRKKHWLSYRLLLPHLLEEQAVSGLFYDEFGKPHLKNHAGHISVAHSGKFSVLVTSRSKTVGVDIEALHPKIFRLAHKFLSPRELEYTFTTHAMESLYVIWCAKEALYKLHGKRGVSFTRDMYVEPFAFTGAGRVKGHISGKGKPEGYSLFYESLDNYMLVYTHA